MSELIKSADLAPKQFNEEQLFLIKNIICKGASDDEIAIFLQICKHTRLDPIAKQIWMIPRWDSKVSKNVYTPQVSIDGARLIADRTGNYAPGRKTEFEYKQDGSLLSATAFVKKKTSDGIWHEIEATAFFEEYVQTYTDKKTNETKVMGLWSSKPHTMIQKVAEMVCLRRGFPSEMSGVYVEGELDKYSVLDVTPVDEVTQAELNELYELSVKCPDLTQKLKEHFKITGFNQLSKRQYDIAKKRLIDEMSKQIQAVMEGE